MSQRIGFAGLGLMGSRMARNIPSFVNEAKINRRHNRSPTDRTGFRSICARVASINFP